jgi:hypothetical protein
MVFTDSMVGMIGVQGVGRGDFGDGVLKMLKMNGV